MLRNARRRSAERDSRKGKSGSAPSPFATHIKRLHPSSSTNPCPTLSTSATSGSSAISAMSFGMPKTTNDRFTLRLVQRNGLLDGVARCEDRASPNRSESSLSRHRNAINALSTRSCQHHRSFRKPRTSLVSSIVYRYTECRSAFGQQVRRKQFFRLQAPSNGW